MIFDRREHSQPIPYPGYPFPQAAFSGTIRFAHPSQPASPNGTFRSSTRVGVNVFFPAKLFRSTEGPMVPDRSRSL